jgi:hypothetical protein
MYPTCMDLIYPRSSAVAQSRYKGANHLLLSLHVQVYITIQLGGMAYHRDQLLATQRRLGHMTKDPSNWSEP